MSGIVTTGSISKLLWPGINQIFGMKYNTYNGEYKQIYSVVNSDKRFEEDVSLQSMGLANLKAEGDAVAYDSFNQLFTKRYIHAMYAKGFAISKEALRDVQYSMNLANIGASAIAESFNQTKETVGAALFNNATSTSLPYIGADGAAMLSASHPLGTGQLSSNIASADISEAALEDAVINIMGFLDDAGKRIALVPDCLFIPKESQFLVTRILESELRPGTGDNDVNALKYKGFFKDIYVNHYFTDPNAWFIKTNLDPMQGFRHFSAIDYELDSQEDFNTKNLLTTALSYFSFGFSNWRCVYGSLGI